MRASDVKPRERFIHELRVYERVGSDVTTCRGITAIFVRLVTGNPHHPVVRFPADTDVVKKDTAVTH
jgi:hypothetical protein